MRKLTLFLAPLLLISCTSKESAKPVLSVSIEPLRYLVEQIAGDDFEVNVLVPPGAGPETYEPTPAQMRRLADSRVYFQIGLIDFEQQLARAIGQNMPQTNVVRLSEGISLIEGTCGHEHHDGHHHGVDPHIWASPKCLKIISETIYGTLAELRPDSVKYAGSHSALQARLDTLDAQLAATFAAGNRHFMIYHPALSYLARDYDLTQIAVEEDGKEPSAEHIRRMIDTARRWQIPRILYQRQFSSSTVEALARELGIEAAAVDPLGYDIEYNLLEISRLIANP